MQVDVSRLKKWFALEFTLSNETGVRIGLISPTHDSGFRKTFVDESWKILSQKKHGAGNLNHVREIEKLFRISSILIW